MARADTGMSGAENHSFSLRKGGTPAALCPPPVTAKSRKVPSGSPAAASPPAASNAATGKNKKVGAGGKKGSVSRGVSSGARNGGAAAALNAASSSSLSLLEKFSTVRDLLPQRLQAVFSVSTSVSPLEKKGGASGMGVATTAPPPGTSPSHQKSLSGNASSLPAASSKKASGGDGVPTMTRRESMAMGATTTEDSIEELFRQLRNACQNSSVPGSSAPNALAAPNAATPSSASTGANLCLTPASSPANRNVQGKKTAADLLGKRGGDGEEAYDRKNGSALPAIGPNAASGGGEEFKRRGKKDGPERKSLSEIPSVAGVRLSVGSRKGEESGSSSPMGGASTKQRSHTIASPKGMPTLSRAKESTGGNGSSRSGGGGGGGGGRLSGGKGTTTHAVAKSGVSNAAPLPASSLSLNASDTLIASLCTTVEAERVTHHILRIHWLLFPSTFPVEEAGILHDEGNERGSSSSLSNTVDRSKNASSAASSPMSTTEHLRAVRESHDGGSSSRAKSQRLSNTGEWGSPSFSSPTGTSGGSASVNPIHNSSSNSSNSSSSNSSSTNSKRAWKVILQKTRSIFPLLLAAARGDIVVHDMSVAACLFTLLYNMLRTIPTEPQRKVVQLCVKLGLHRICANVLQVCGGCSNPGALLRPHDLGFHTASEFVSSETMQLPHGGNPNRPAASSAPPLRPFPSSIFSFPLDRVEVVDPVSSRHSSSGGNIQSGGGSATPGSAVWKSSMRLKVAARVCEAAALLLSLSVMSSSKVSATAKSSGVLLYLTQAVETYGGVLEHRLSQHRSAADFVSVAARPASGQEGEDKNVGSGSGGASHHSTAAHLLHSKAAHHRSGNRSVDGGNHSGTTTTTTFGSLRGLMGRGGGGADGGDSAGMIPSGARDERDAVGTLSSHEKQRSLAAVKHFLDKTEFLLQCYLRLMLVLHLLSRSSANVQEIGAALSSSSSPPLLTVTTKVFLSLLFFLTHIFPKVLKGTAFRDIPSLLPLAPHVEALSDRGPYVPSFLLQSVRLFESNLFWSLMIIRRICAEEACAERAISEVHHQHLLRSLFKLIQHMAGMQHPSPAPDGGSPKEEKMRGGPPYPSLSMAVPPLRPPPPALPFRRSPSSREMPPPLHGHADDPHGPSPVRGAATSHSFREGSSPSSSALLLPHPKESSAASSLLLSPSHATPVSAHHEQGHLASRDVPPPSSSSSSSSYPFLCIRHPKMVHVVLHTFGMILNGQERSKGLRDLQEVNGSLTALVEHVLCIPDPDPAEWQQRYHHLCEIFGVCLLPSLKTSFPISLGYVSTATSLNSSCNGSLQKSESSQSNFQVAPRRRLSLQSSSSSPPSGAAAPHPFPLASSALPTPSTLPSTSSGLLEHTPFFDPELNLRLPVHLLQSVFGAGGAEEKGGAAAPPLTSASARGLAPTAEHTPPPPPLLAVPPQGSSEKSGRTPVGSSLFSSARRGSTGEKPRVGSARDEPTSGLPPVQEGSGGRVGSTLDGGGPFSASCTSVPAHAPPRRAASGRGGLGGPSMTAASGLWVVDTQPALLFPELLGGVMDPSSRMPPLEATPLPWDFSDPPPPSTMVTLSTLPKGKREEQRDGDAFLPLAPPTPETIVRILRHHIARLLRLPPECSDFTRYHHTYAVVYERRGLLHQAFTYGPGEEGEEEETVAAVSLVDKRSEAIGSARDKRRKKRSEQDGVGERRRRQRRRSGSLDSTALPSSTPTHRPADLDGEAAEPAAREPSFEVIDSADLSSALSSSALHESVPSTLPLFVADSSSGGEAAAVAAEEEEAGTRFLPSRKTPVEGGGGGPPPPPLAVPRGHAKERTSSASTPTLPTPSKSPPHAAPQRSLPRPSTAGSAPARRAPGGGGGGGGAPLAAAVFPTRRRSTSWMEGSALPTDGANRVQTLVFASNFESGNLQRAIRITPDEYDLVLSFDTCTNSFVQWFCFSVTNYSPGQKYRFNILNMEKPASTFNDGQRPLLLHIPLTAEEEEEVEKERKDNGLRPRRMDGAGAEGGVPLPTTVVIMSDHGVGGTPAGPLPSDDASISLPSSLSVSGSASFPSPGSPAPPPPPPSWTRVGEDIYYFPNSFRRPGRETAKKVFSSSKGTSVALSSLLAGGGNRAGNGATTTSCSSVTSSSSFRSVVRPSQPPLPLLNVGSLPTSASTTATAGGGGGGRRGKARRSHTAKQNSVGYSGSTSNGMSGGGVVSFFTRGGRAPHPPGGMAEAAVSPEEQQYYSALVQKESRYYTLAFTVTMPHTRGKVYLANCFPYTYSDLRHLLDHITTVPRQTTPLARLSRTPTTTSSSRGRRTPETCTPDTHPDEEVERGAAAAAAVGTFPPLGTRRSSRSASTPSPAGGGDPTMAPVPPPPPPPPPPSSFMVQQLCVTNCGVPIPLVTATAMFHSALQVPYTTEEIQRRPVCVMTGRVHPGESNASWMMHGILDFLAAGAREIDRRQEAGGATPFSSDASVAVALLESFVFKVVPMVNVDGVIMGNHRCSILGVDLNREYLRPTGESHPVLYALKGLLSYMAGVGRRRIAVAADFHGHSRAKNFLLYGCTRETLIHSFKLTKKVPSDCFMDPATGVMCTTVAPEKLFSAVLAQYCTAFDLCHSNFCIQRGKFNTNRVVLYREYGIRMCYGVEASMMGGRGAVTSYAAAAGAFMHPDTAFPLSSFAREAAASPTATGRGGHPSETGEHQPQGSGGGHAGGRPRNGEEPSPWECATEDFSSPSRIVETHYSEATFSAFGMAFLWSLHTLGKSERVYGNDRFLLPGASNGGGGSSAAPAAASVPEDSGVESVDGKEEAAAKHGMSGGGEPKGEDETSPHSGELLQEPLAMKQAWLMVSQAGSGRQSPPGFTILHPSTFPSSLWDALPSNWNGPGGSGLGPWWTSVVQRKEWGSGASGPMSHTGSGLSWSGHFGSQAVPLLLVPLFSPSCALFSTPPASPLLPPAGIASAYGPPLASGRHTTSGLPPRVPPPPSSERGITSNGGSTNVALWKTMRQLAFSHLLPLSVHQRLQILNVLFHDTPLTVSLDDCMVDSGAANGGGGGGDDDDDGGEDDDDGKWGGGKGKKTITSQDTSGGGGGGGFPPKSTVPRRSRKEVRDSQAEKVDESDSDGESGESEVEGETDFSPPPRRHAPPSIREEEEDSGEGVEENDEDMEDAEEGVVNNEDEREDGDDGEG